MTAAMYSSRANLKTGVIESFMFGGQMMNTSDVENYPSIQNITGAELSEKIYDSSMRFGAETIYASVKKITLIENLKEVHTDNGVILARSIIIATGSHHRELGLDNERELAGKEFLTALYATELSLRIRLLQ